ncbi:tRNA cyclic N6-threonylcarbamoyladenosine(37) synthase TcdA [Chitinimonas sp. DQS-5]|uniref:tRNA cyclic N6-threonylcarbamoyladenosine(37) synthase TcdA n=2 Tax=Parachitinimonas caeni TaxID=3031301 RepID=A0ABT7DRZ9_9NEIS|nr:tRNA cyclic N6-threonylcarbamoyladenosine(37) synthase TcdA [Parachitinimonas caeni]MDK2122839.1 tRNA cyclic N6-threonylcarbamoyladenosine(37) synthase TcdA [Parachitinimonas caeni]
MEHDDYERRFGGVGRLFGDAGWQRFQAAHVCVIGLGGVGSWAAEALARSAVGKLTLIDLDNVAVSNVNRQLHAMNGEFGKPKVTAMSQRLKAINPRCDIVEIEEFVEEANFDRTLGAGYDCVLDCIDGVRTKAALIAYCRERAIPLVTVGGAGGQVDPTQIKVSDLALTIQDPLLAKVRALLRKNYGFPREAKRKFGVECVFSTEPLRYPEVACEVDEVPQRPQGLNCAGFGSSMCVTATFGLFAAARVLNQLSAGTLTES